MTKSSPWPVIGRTIFFTSDKNRPTNQKPAITHRDEIYFIDFWRENLSMYRIILFIYPYSPHRREWNFLGGGGFCKTQKVKTMCEALLELPEGWVSGVLEKLPSVGEVWIFSVVTHCLLIWITNLRGML